MGNPIELCVETLKMNKVFAPSKPICVLPRLGFTSEFRTSSFDFERSFQNNL